MRKLTLLVCIIFFLARFSSAGELSSLLPEKTIAYMEINSIRKVNEWAQKEVGIKDELQKFILLLDERGVDTSKPVSFFRIDVEESDGLLCTVKEKREAQPQGVYQLEKKFLKFGWAVKVGDNLAFVTSPQVGETILEVYGKKKGSLKDSTFFKKSDEHIFAYINMEEILSKFLPMMNLFLQGVRRSIPFTEDEDYLQGMVREKAFQKTISRLKNLRYFTSSIYIEPGKIKQKHLFYIRNLTFPPPQKLKMFKYLPGDVPFAMEFFTHIEETLKENKSFLESIRQEVATLPEEKKKGMEKMLLELEETMINIPAKMDEAFGEPALFSLLKSKRELPSFLMILTVKDKKIAEELLKYFLSLEPLKMSKLKGEYQSSPLPDIQYRGKVISGYRIKKMNTSKNIPVEEFTLSYSFLKDRLLISGIEKPYPITTLIDMEEEGYPFASTYQKIFADFPDTAHGRIFFSLSSLSSITPPLQPFLRMKVSLPPKIFPQGICGVWWFEQDKLIFQNTISTSDIRELFQNLRPPKQ